jgi:hypothetical protein
MGNRYEITYHKVKVISNVHIKEVEKINPLFCCYEPYYIDYELGAESGALLCDGEFIIHAPEGLETVVKSDEVEPSNQVRHLEVRHLVNKELFNV